MLSVLFKPEELKATLRALDDLRSSFQPDEPVVDTLFGEVRRTALKTRAKIIARVKHQGSSPRDVALLMISEGSCDWAVRKPGSQGEAAMQTVFALAGDAMVASGYLDDAQNQANKKSLREALSLDARERLAGCLPPHFNPSAPV